MFRVVLLLVLSGLPSVAVADIVFNLGGNLIGDGSSLNGNGNMLATALGGSSAGIW